MASEKRPYPVKHYLHMGKILAYYAYSSVAPNDLLESFAVRAVPASPSVLSLAHGDIRSCFYSIWRNFPRNGGSGDRFSGVRFVLNDRSAAVLARNVLLLYLTLKMPSKKEDDELAVKEWLAALWAIWFCHELRPEHRSTLNEALVSWSSSLDRWNHEVSQFGVAVAFSSSATLSNIRSKWKMWLSGIHGVQSVEQVKQMRFGHMWMFQQLRKVSDSPMERIKQLSTNFVRFVQGVEQTSLLYSHTCPKYQAMEKEMQAFLVNSTPFVEGILGLQNDVVETSVNYTFFEHADGTYTLYHLAVPFESFFQNFQYSLKELKEAGIDRHTLSSLVVDDKFFERSPFLANSLQQLSLWLFATADVIARLRSEVSFALDCSDAIEFCQRMCADPHFTSVCGSKFDVILSSNLIDHTSPPSLVLSAIPLLKPNAFLFTAVTMYRHIAPNINKYLHAVFGFEPEMLPLICGIRCVGYEGQFCDQVLLQPMAVDANNMVMEFGVSSCRELVWQRVGGLPFLISSPDRSSACAKALRDAALIVPRFKPSFGNTTLRYMSTETAVLVIKSFASLCLASISDFHFWEGIASLFQKEKDLQYYLLHLQTQCQLHGLHIHLVEGHCSFCNPSCTLSQFSVPLRNGK